MYQGGGVVVVTFASHARMRSAAWLARVTRMPPGRVTGEVVVMAICRDRHEIMYQGVLHSAMVPNLAGNLESQ